MVSIVKLAPEWRHAEPFMSLASVWSGHQCSRDRGTGSGRRRAPVVCHMGIDKVTGSKRAAETELSGQHASGYDSSQLASIVARICGVSSPNTEEIEHSALGLEHCPPAYRTNFDARHRNADLKIAIVTEVALAT